MSIQQLQEIERTLGFSYPASFVSMFAEFQALLGTEGFRSLFPGASLIWSAPDIAAAQADMPAAFLPFMREVQPSWPEYYAFDLGSGGPEFRVVVWSDHAVVMDWENFPVFLAWIHEHIARDETSP
ncbi:MAG: hypothetical protein NTY98_05960 [Verrucomicrobia bacterium]|nr:hypothetical protein [Verrucomicrobiota bacterium]